MNCSFCEAFEPIEDEYGAYEARIVKLTPLPAINLTTGEVEEKTEPPFYSLFIYDDPDEGEKGSFPIKYCPLCGRNLFEDFKNEL